jgi:hypothetical protein
LLWETNPSSNFKVYIAIRNNVGDGKRKEGSNKGRRKEGSGSIEADSYVRR